MDEDAKLRELGSGRIASLLWRFAWPSFVTMGLNMLYNVVDRVYIGHGCGTDAIAGLTMTFPVMMVLGAFGPLVGVGSGTVISISLGEGDRSKAERALGQCVAMKLLMGVTVAPVLFCILRPLLSSMAGGGVTDAAMDLARLYLRIVVPFHFLAHLAFGLSACMRSEGAPVPAMACLATGAIANFILDPIFIFARIPLGPISVPGLGLGVAGAAWATNLSMCISCATALLHYASGRSVLRLRATNIRIFRDLAPRVLAIGLSPFLMQFAGSTINFSINHAFARWSGDPATGAVQIAAFGIFQTVSMLFFIPSIGIQQGFGPIIGYNWGAKAFARVRRCMDIAVLLTSAVMVCGCLVQLLFAWPIAWCIADAPGVTDAGAFAIRIGTCMVWCIGLNVAATTYFQSIGRPRTAIILSLMRQVLILLPCVWVLPHMFPSHPILAIWLALPISDALTFLASIPPMLKERRSLSAEIAAAA